MVVHLRALSVAVLIVVVLDVVKALTYVGQTWTLIALVVAGLLTLWSMLDPAPAPPA